MEEGILRIYLAVCIIAYTKIVLVLAFEKMTRRHDVIHYTGAKELAER